MKIWKFKNLIFKTDNLISFLTIVIALTIILLDIITDYISDQIMFEALILILSLTTITNIVERETRINLTDSKINEINEQLTKIKESPKHILKKRTEIIPPDKMAENASSIHALAISAYSIGVPYIDFYKRKLKEGCDIKFILFDPDSNYLEAYNQLNFDYIDAKSHIYSSLRVLKPLSEAKDYKGKFEIRLSEVFFPFSIIGVDFGNEKGKMNVEFHCYKVSLDSRPHIFLEKEKDLYWFNFYHNQFELAWANANRI